MIGSPIMSPSLISHLVGYWNGQLSFDQYAISQPMYNNTNKY